ncbi:universal stress protein [Candidatus Pacearchaeota archaeon]|nr:MAG: universal stress protein [Candidatus Pacearchaeota archaeon]
MKNWHILKRVLLPVDESKHSKKAVTFAGRFLKNFSEDLSEITLLHVVRLSYLSTHMKIDLRAEFIKESEMFKKLKAQFLEEKIKPFLNQYEKILRKSGIETEINQKIEEGDPGNEIIEILSKEDYSTVMLSRRGMSKIRSLVLGSVPTKLLYHLKKEDIYFIGKKFSKDSINPISSILIPVDGSEYSKRAVEHAVYIAKKVKDIKKIKILKVIDVDFYYKRIDQGIDPEKEAEEIIAEARKKIIEESIPEELVLTQISRGIPAQEIIKDVRENQYDLVIIGRKGRSHLKDLVIGGVSSAVIYHCQEPTIVVINF